MLGDGVVQDFQTTEEKAGPRNLIDSETLKKNRIPSILLFIVSPGHTDVRFSRVVQSQLKMPESIEDEKFRDGIERVQPSQPPPEAQQTEKTTADHLNVGSAEQGDGASHSTTLTTTPLVPHPGPEPAQDSALERFNSITRRDGRHLQEPPALPFNLRDHKLSLSIFTFLALAECCFVPIAFYYGFSQGTNVRSGTYGSTRARKLMANLPIKVFISPSSPACLDL